MVDTDRKIVAIRTFAGDAARAQGKPVEKTAQKKSPAKPESSAPDQVSQPVPHKAEGSADPVEIPPFHAIRATSPEDSTYVRPSKVTKRRHKQTEPQPVPQKRVPKQIEREVDTVVENFDQNPSTNQSIDPFRGGSGVMITDTRSARKGFFGAIASFFSKLFTRKERHVPRIRHADTRKEKIAKAASVAARAPQEDYGNILKDMSEQMPATEPEPTITPAEAVPQPHWESGQPVQANSTEGTPPLSADITDDSSSFFAATSPLAKEEAEHETLDLNRDSVPGTFMSPSTNSRPTPKPDVTPEPDAPAPVTQPDTITEESDMPAVPQPEPEASPEETPEPENEKSVRELLADVGIDNEDNKPVAPSSEPSNGIGLSTISMLVVGIVVIIGISVYAYLTFFAVTEPTTTPTTTPTTAPIVSGETTTVTFSDDTPLSSTLQQALRPGVDTRLAVVFSNNVPITNAVLINELFPSMPEQLERSVQTISIGSVAGKLYVELTVDSFDIAVSSLLDWEPHLYTELETLFMTLTASSSAFTDLNKEDAASSITRSTETGTTYHVSGNTIIITPDLQTLQIIQSRM